MTFFSYINKNYALRHIESLNLYFYLLSEHTCAIPNLLLSDQNFWTRRTRVRITSTTSVCTFAYVDY
jgi:hypothetical protein